MAKKKPQKLGDHAEQAFETSPIYKHARVVLATIQVVVANMPQQQKYIMGKALSEACVALIETVCWAYMENEPKKKAALVKLILRKVSSALILHRIADDLHLFAGREVYIAQVDGLVSIIKQANGWLESSRKKAADALPDKPRQA